MKTVLIILGILLALALFGLLFPAIIAGGIAYLLFTSGHFGWGIVCCIVGLIAEIGYILGVVIDSDGDYHDYHDDGVRSGITWPQAFTALYIIDHIRNKDD